MGKYVIVAEEWYPVYSLQDPEDWGGLDEEDLEILEANDPLVKRYKKCMAEFEELQKILEGLY